MNLQEELRIHLSNVVKAVIGTEALTTGGKKNPAKLRSGSGMRPKDEEKKENESSDEMIGRKSVTVEIAKADNEKQIVTGIVLEPETVDAQDESLCYISQENRRLFLQ